MNNTAFYKGKVVWITGASSGMGEALVYSLSSLGAEVVASSNEIEELNRVRGRCTANGKDILTVPFDLSVNDGIEAMANEVFAKKGRIDILINMGGVSQRSLIVDTPIWLDRKIMEINYFGSIALSKAVLPLMIKQGGGHILVTSSISGRFGFPLRSAYSASKQALHGFIETLHIENSKNNIRGSAIIPGRVRTKISIRALNSDGTEHGKMDPGQEKGISPEKAAGQILRGIRLNRREILVGSSELIMLHIRRFLPFIFFRIAGKIKN
jgi:short-subunit dehydrogenase